MLPDPLDQPDDSGPPDNTSPALHLAFRVLDFAEDIEAHAKTDADRGTAAYLRRVVRNVTPGDNQNSHATLHEALKFAVERHRAIVGNKEAS